MPTSQGFDLPDGGRTTVEWFGDAAAPKGVVALLPALGVGIGFYRPLCTAWAQLGYEVAAVELRGGKQSSARDLRKHDFGYHEILTLDLPAILPALRARAAGRHFWLAGHSLGGQFALLHASRHADAATGIVLLAAGSNYYASVPKKKRLQRYLGVRLVRLLAKMLGYFPGHKLGFGGKQPRNLMLDWSCEALTGRYTVLGEDGVDHDGALAALPLPVLMVSLRGDPLVPRSCADLLARKLVRARVEQVEITGRRPFSHFHWVKDPAPVLATVDAWMSTTAEERRHGTNQRSL